MIGTGGPRATPVDECSDGGMRLFIRVFIQLFIRAPRRVRKSPSICGECSLGGAPE